MVIHSVLLFFSDIYNNSIYYFKTSTMVKVEGDYSDVLAYMARLFAIKKIREIKIDRFSVAWNAALVITDITEGATSRIVDLPDIDDVDRLKALELRVGGLTDTEVTVTIDWDSVTVSNVDNQEIIDYFLDVLDKSTFRYF